LLEKNYAELSDFDNHLDDLRNDWLNKNLNETIMKGDIDDAAVAFEKKVGRKKND
jgi:hypothetical protein